MKAIINISLALAVVITTMSFCTVADVGGEWQRLGSRMVNMGGDHDEIPVTAYKGAFTKLRVKVKGAPIHLRNMRVIFGNGQDMNVKVGHKFAPGAERIVDLPGNKRIIKKIKLNYTTVPTVKGRAEVVIWGKR